jgi:hypothetical protein
VGAGTEAPGPMPGLRAQLGFGPDGSSPEDNAAWTWVEAAFNTQAGNNDEFQATLQPEAVGSYDYAYRYSTTNGRDWVYADLDGSPNGYSPSQAGDLSVVSSGDLDPPAAPGGLAVLSASPAGIELGWDAVAGASLYEVQRADSASGPFERVARTDMPSFIDTTVVEGATYHYVVVAIDASFNRSGSSASVEATAARRTVSVQFGVTVPASTDGEGRPVSIAGTLSRLDGGHPDWTPGAVDLTRVDATHWTVTLTGLESTQIAYKYVIESDVADAWAYVEKGASCDEIGDRQLTLSYGSTGVQAVSDTVLNWRNVPPCGN